VSFQGVDANGNPDGTPDQTRLVETGSIAANSWVTTGLITSDGTDTGVKRTVTQGELLAIVVEFASFVLNDSLQIRANALAAWSTVSLSIYRLHNTASTWGTRAGQVLNIALQYDDNVWEPMPYCIPAETAFSTTYTSATNPNVRGVKFVCPIAMRTIGVAAQGLFNTAATSTGIFHLYDSDDVELASVTVDPDTLVAVGNGFRTFYWDAVADSVELVAGETYRVVLEATGAGALAVNGYVPDSTALSSACPWGADASMTTRKDTGSWTDATDGTFLAMALLVDGIDVSSGSSTAVIIRRFYED
jgi:hypothetical protein